MFRVLSRNEQVLVNQHFEGTKEDLMNAFMVGYEFEARLNDEPIYDVFVRRRAAAAAMPKPPILPADATLEQYVSSMDDFIASCRERDSKKEDKAEVSISCYELYFGDETVLSPKQRKIRMKFLNSSRYRRVRFQWKIDEGDIKDIDDLAEIAAYLKHYEAEYCGNGENDTGWKVRDDEAVYFGDRAVLSGMDKLSRDEFFKKPKIRAMVLSRYDLTDNTTDEQFREYLIGRKKLSVAEPKCALLPVILE